MRKNRLVSPACKRRAAGKIRRNGRIALDAKPGLRNRNRLDSREPDGSARGTILVPLDFTEVSRRALDYALSVASKLNCSVALLHVLQRTYAEAFVNSDQRQEIRSRVRAEALKTLNSLARAKYMADVPLNCIIRDGVPEHEIPRTAEHLKVKLIVLGRRKRSPLGRAIFGSVTADVVDTAPCPVLVFNDSGFFPRGIGI